MHIGHFHFLGFVSIILNTRINIDYFNIYFFYYIYYIIYLCKIVITHHNLHEIFQTKRLQMFAKNSLHRGQNSHKSKTTLQTNRNIINTNLIIVIILLLAFHPSLKLYNSFLTFFNSLHKLFIIQKLLH